ncbi:MAG: hypothetical protein ABI440_11795, partial [Casimicrobiaceae bacterium]
AFAQRCADARAKLRSSVEATSFDGAWYRRAWFDDGTPLGVAADDECRVDSIAQSWAVLSGMADPARARLAMQAVDAELMRRDIAVVLLLAPPFNTFKPNPGYIKGYLPGVRENGAQYTHAAVWVAMAFAALGDARRTWEVFTMLNPLAHADSAARIATYMTEPYVIASDVYSLPPNAGRGGWTWYTGAAGWMYRLIVESILGVSVEAGRLRLRPCIPREWDTYRVDYRYGTTLYRIVATQHADNASTRMTLDGVACTGDFVTLVDDNVEHSVNVHWQCAHD